VRLARIARVARELGLKTWLAAAGWGVALAVLYPLHRFEINFYWAPWEFLVNLAFCVLTAWSFLLAIVIADASVETRPTPMRRYVVAIALAAATCASYIAARAPHVPGAPYDVLAGKVIRPAGRALAYRPFREFMTRGAYVTLYGSLGAFGFIVLRNARNAARALEEAELLRSTASQRLLASRLAATRARVDPEVTLRELERIEALYEHDRVAADALMDDLIVRLREAIPRVRAEEGVA
jgi:hypothetical protein